MGNKNTVFENYSKSLIFFKYFVLRATSQVTEGLNKMSRNLCLSGISLNETLEAQLASFLFTNKKIPKFSK